MQTTNATFLLFSSNGESLLLGTVKDRHVAPTTVICAAEPSQEELVEAAGKLTGVPINMEDGAVFDDLGSLYKNGMKNTVYARNLRQDAESAATGSWVALREAADFFNVSSDSHERGLAVYLELRLGQPELYLS